MARQLRIEYEGAFYHVTSRGNLRDRIFFDNRDREKFIDILKRTKERYSYLLHAYVLMDNHYHLLIETPLANLKQIMQNVNTSYTVSTNRKYGRSGHLFQGRYKSIIVDKENYLAELSRYIHLNPVRAEIVKSPGEYKWSSYSRFMDGSGTQEVDVTDILSYFGDDMRTARRRYTEFVEAGINDHMRNPFKEAKEGIILGGEDFIKNIKDIVKGMPRDRELPSLKMFQRRVQKDIIVRSVSEFYSLNGSDLRRRTRRYTKQRKVAIYLSKVVNAEKNPVIAEYFGISPQGVSNVITEMESELKGSRRLGEEIKKIEEILSEEICYAQN
jgi:putative transposase